MHLLQNILLSHFLSILQYNTISNTLVPQSSSKNTQIHIEILAALDRGWKSVHMRTFHKGHHTYTQYRHMQSHEYNQPTTKPYTKHIYTYLMSNRVQLLVYETSRMRNFFPPVLLVVGIFYFFIFSFPIRICSVPFHFIAFDWVCFVYIFVVVDCRCWLARKSVGF